MARKIYPIRNETGDPIGSTIGAESSTDARLWVETSMRSGEVVNIAAPDGALFLDVVCVLKEILTQQKVTNEYLANFNGESITTDEIDK